VSFASLEFFNHQTARPSAQYSLVVAWCYLRGRRLPFKGTPAVIVRR
jgi:hypothetical protein